MVCRRIRHDEQGVVIEHLLEMRDKIPPVRGIARKSAADLVKDTAKPHLRQRFFCHFERSGIIMQTAVQQQKQQAVGCGKLRRTAKSAIIWVKAPS